MISRRKGRNKPVRTPGEYETVVPVMLISILQPFVIFSNKRKKEASKSLNPGGRGVILRKRTRSGRKGGYGRGVEWKKGKERDIEKD